MERQIIIKHLYDVLEKFEGVYSGERFEKRFFSFLVDELYFITSAPKITISKVIAPLAGHFSYRNSLKRVTQKIVTEKKTGTKGTVKKPVIGLSNKQKGKNANKNFKKREAKRRRQTPIVGGDASLLKLARVPNVDWNLVKKTAQNIERSVNVEMEKVVGGFVVRMEQITKAEKQLFFNGVYRSFIRNVRVPSIGTVDQIVDKSGFLVAMHKVPKPCKIVADSYMGLFTFDSDYETGLSGKCILCNKKFQLTNNVRILDSNQTLIGFEGLVHECELY